MRRTGVDMEIGEKLGGGDVNKLQLLLYILSVGSLRMCICIRRQVMRVYEARTFWPHWMAAPPVTVYWMPGSPLCILPSSLLFLSLSLPFILYSLFFFPSVISFRPERERDRSQFSGVNVRARERLYPPGR